jgi:hypothetical protein
MPWSIQRREGKYCVVKQGGEVLKCYPNRTDAIKYQRALYAHEPSARRASMDQVGNVYGTNTTSIALNPIIAAVVPLKPPRKWFETSEPDGPFPMTYEDNGQVYGHLAAWQTCHAGLASGAFSECVRPPQSRTNYERFHLGLIQTEEGDMLPVGKIVLATGHAPMSADLMGATKHYDDTGSVGAFIRASNGKHGIWTSGVLRSDLSPEGLRDLRANPPSGDWRAFNHNLELVAALAVPVPGFPIPQSQLALAASGEISALILTDVEEEPIMAAARSKDYLRKKKALSRRWQS